MTTLVYNAPPSVQGFLQSTSFVSLIMGPDVKAKEITE